MRFKSSAFSQKKRLSLILLLVFAFSFLIAPSALAGFGDWAGEVVGSIIGVFISALGLIMILVIKALLLIAEYQHFIDIDGVKEGWTIVRDISNMFFVVILLVIAFSTILHLENYSYKKWLPKLILMAVLINFSKTICGLMIDVAQIVMLTFVNSFKDIAGGNFIDMLGILDVVRVAKASDTTGFWVIVGAYVLGLIYMIIALVVIVTMTAVLAMRLVMIWIYVVLSPLAYLLSAFPGGAQYSSQWWKEFTQNLIVGPVLAFFIWLSFATLQTGKDLDIVTTAASSTSEVSQEANSNLIYRSGGASSTADEPVASSKASTPGVLVKFIVAIGMLIGGLKIAQQIGGTAGGIAGKGMAKLNKMGASTAGFGKKWAGKIASGDNMLARKSMKAIGFDVRPVTIASAIKSSFEKTKKDDEDEIRSKGRANLKKGGVRAVFGGAGAGQDWANNYVDGFLGIKGIKHAIQEIGIRPGQRRRLGDKLNQDKKDLENAKKEQKQYLTTADYKKQDDDIKQKDLEVKGVEVDISNLKFKIKNGNWQPGDAEKLKELTKKRDDMKVGIDKQRADLSTKKVDDDKYNSLTETIKTKEKDINTSRENLAHIAPPQALEGLGEYRKVINDRKSKYKDETNSDKLLQLFEDAVRRKDKFDQFAILEKLSNDGNFNEVLNRKGYSANSKGLHDFLHNEKNEQGEKRGLDVGLGKQEILQIQNDISESEERVGHWEMAKTVGVNDKGELESLVGYKTDENGKQVWDDERHVEAASAEIAKMDPQKIVLSLNRLAYGGEDSNGKFQLSNLGRVLTKMLDQGGTYASQAPRIQQNIAFNLTSDNVLEELKKIGITANTIEVLQKRGRPDGNSLRPSDVLNTLKQAGLIA